MRPRSLARIDLGALDHNLARIRQLAPRSQLLAVVKANGYGHGLAGICAALGKADAAGVATVEEAACLRDSGWQGRLLLLQGFASGEELEAARALDAEVVVHQQTQLDVLSASPVAFRQRLWIKLETGMHRLGFPVSRLTEILTALEGHELGLMTHFASADRRDDSSVMTQLEKFSRATDGLSLPRSLANSAAPLNYPTSHADMVRCGLMLFGVSPLATGSGRDLGLRPVMRFSSRLLSIRQCRAGDRVGYAGSWVCPEAMSVGIVALGYGDGYPWAASSDRQQGPVMVKIRGVACPLVGRVSMDMLTVDLRPLGDIRAEPDDEVLLWGDELPVEELARSAGTIPYELLCGLSGRVRYQYSQSS